MIDSFNVHQMRRRLTDGQKRWLPPLVAALVLALTFAVAYVGTLDMLVLVLVGVSAIAGLVILVRWPALGIILSWLLGVFVPYRGPSGLNLTMIVVAGLLALWLLDLLLRRDKVRLRHSRMVPPLLAMALVGTVALVVGQLPWFQFEQHAPLGAQLGGWAMLLLAVGGVLLVGQRMDVLWLERFTWLFLAIAGVYFAARAVPSVLGVVILPLFRAGDFGALFWVWTVALGAGQLVYNRKLSRQQRVLLTLVVLATLYAGLVLNYREKSSWIPPVTVLAVILMLRSWRVTVALGIVGGLVALVTVPAVIESDAYSFSTRLDALAIMADIVRTSPIIGLGFANYRYYTVDFRIRGYAVQFNSHNNYADIVAQMGFVGLACFFWFFFVVTRLAWELRDRVPEGFARGYVFGALGGIVGTLLAAMMADWVLPFFYNIGMTGFRAALLGWMFIGGLMTLELAMQDKDATQ
jgi:hypothetical protein